MQTIEQDEEEQERMELLGLSDFKCLLLFLFLLFS